MQVHLSALDLTIGQVKFNLYLVLIKFFEFCTSQPIQGNHTAIISSLQQSTQSWCQFHPVPAEKYKVSVFELVSSKQPIHLHDVKYAVKLESEQLTKEDASYKEYTQ